ncbi:hypothetical protein BH23CHL5_BH23CHL5_10210 [soil metagenome]
MRSAIVDYFRDFGQIMIATEAGAEGINLQFCSLVVNYDLPWNPQRIEQRIGRCHRYGQKHDVVVVNFLNQNNAADQRVYELLSEKFKLFEGVFGASDEVLGAIESGVDLEKRIADIYQRCRVQEEIQAAFDELQRELSAEIDVAMTRTRQQLLENFDDEVTDKLRARDESSRSYLNRYERLLMRLTRHELDGHARFDGDGAFTLDSRPLPGEFPLGRYELPRRSGHAHLYRLNHPLAEALLDRAKCRSLQYGSLVFVYGGYDGKISALEPFIGRTGWLELSILTMEGPDLAEDHLIVAAFTDDGTTVDPEIASRLLNIPGAHVAGGPELHPDERVRSRLNAIAVSEQQAIVAGSAERNAAFFEQEMTKLDAWAQDKRVSLRQEMRKFDNEIDAARKLARAVGNLPDKLALQRKINQLESKRDEAELAFRDASKDIKVQRDKVLDDVEARLKRTTERRECFTIRWSLQ